MELIKKHQEGSQIIPFNEELNMIHKPTYGSTLPEVKVVDLLPERLLNLSSDQLNTYTQQSLERSNMLERVAERPDYKKLLQFSTGLALTPAALLLGPTLGAANKFIESVPTLRHIRTGLDLVGSADGIRNAASGNGIRKTVNLARNEGASWNTVKSGLGDALDLLGITDVARFGVNRFLRPTFNREAAVANIKPLGYNSKHESTTERSKIKQFSDYLSDLRSGNINQRVDYNNLYKPKDYNNDPIVTNVRNKGREDAFRIYMGLKPKHNIFIKNSNGTWSYNLNNKDLQYSIPLMQGFQIGSSYDFVTEAGGGVRLKDYPSFTRQDINNNTRNYGYFEMTDLWDLQPFSREDDRLKRRLKDGLYDKLFINPIRNAADKIYTTLYPSLFDRSKRISKYAYPIIGKPLNKTRTSFGLKIDKNGRPHQSPLKQKIINSKSIENIDNKLKDFEVGPVIGGKPYLVTTNIPYTKIINLDGSIRRELGFTPSSVYLKTPPNSTYTLFEKPYYSFNLNKDIPGTINTSSK